MLYGVANYIIFKYVHKCHKDAHNKKITSLRNICSIDLLLFLFPAQNCNFIITHPYLFY